MRAPKAFIYFIYMTILSSSIIQPTNATLDVIIRDDAGRLTSKKSHLIAAFIHYDAPSSRGVNGSAVVLRGKEACGKVNAELVAKVRDMIVFSEFRDCRINDIYKSMDRAGAKALVIIEPLFKRPGYATFYCYDCHDKDSPRGLVHPSWDDGRKMPMVSVSSMGDEDSLADAPTMEEVHLSPPFDRTFENLFLSYHYTLLARVLAPALSVTASFLASAEVVRLNRTGRLRRAWVAAFICTIEAPVLFMVGLILAFGHFGPMALDFIYHEILRELFLGLSVSTTLLFAFFLREESRCLIHSLPRRPIWKIHRWGLAASSCLFASFVLRPFAMISSYRSAWQATLTVNVALTIALQYTVAIFSLAQSRAIFRHFNGFLMAETAASRSQAAIKKFTVCVAVTSICMLVCSSSLVTLYTPYTIGVSMAYDVGTYYALSLIFVFSRIGFSFSQIIGITPNVQLRCLQNRVLPLPKLPHSGTGLTTGTRAQIKRFTDFKRHGPRPMEESSCDTSQSRKRRSLDAIEEVDEENLSGSVLFSSRQPSGYGDTSDQAPCSLGLTESSIHYSERSFSDYEVCEFPPCPED